MYLRVLGNSHGSVRASVLLQSQVCWPETAPMSASLQVIQYYWKTKEEILEWISISEGFYRRQLL